MLPQQMTEDPLNRSIKYYCECSLAILSSHRLITFHEQMLPMSLFSKLSSLQAQQIWPQLSTKQFYSQFTQFSSCCTAIKNLAQDCLKFNLNYSEGKEVMSVINHSSFSDGQTVNGSSKIRQCFNSVLYFLWKIKFF